MNTPYGKAPAAPVPVPSGPSWRVRRCEAKTGEGRRCRNVFRWSFQGELLCGVHCQIAARQNKLGIALGKILAPRPMRNPVA